jgi:serine/threonine protein phosphatase PrpC
MRIGYKSDLGKARELDEDCTAVVSIDAVCESRTRKATLLIIADGMGGHNAGEVASRLALKRMTEEISNLMLREISPDSPEYVRKSLEMIIEDVNKYILQIVEKNPRYKGMGTTLTAALVQGSSVYIGHVGDSRAYIVSENRIEQITKDHSYVQELLDRNEITPEQARGHSQKNLITRAIGLYKDVKVDVASRYIFGDDYLLLCCDGLTDVVTDEEIHTVILQNDDPQRICDILVQEANQKGGLDNISVIVAQFDEIPKKSDETYVKRRGSDPRWTKTIR